MSRPESASGGAAAASATSRPTAEQVETFRQSLQPWIDGATHWEDRAKAARRIILAYEENLEYLQITELGLTSLPPQIGNLENLRSLNCHGNRLTSIPDEIGNLRNLVELRLDKNYVLSSIPNAIGNLENLAYLDLTTNQLTTIQDSIFRRGFKLHAEDNHFVREEAQRLNALAQERGCRFHFSIYEPMPEISYITLPLYVLEGLTDRRESNSETVFLPDPFAPTTVPTTAKGVIPEILAKETDETKRAELTEFLKADKMEAFRTFANQCSRTKSWENTDARNGLISALHLILRAMNDDETGQIKDMVIASIVGAHESCGDRVAMALVDAQLIATIGVKKFTEETQTEELLENARQRAVVDFLKQQAEAKYKSRGGDEVEVYLAYMQAAKTLGIELRGADMLYRGCSNVSDQDLEKAVSEFNSVTSPIAGISMSQYLTCRQMLDVEAFEAHPFVRRAREETEKHFDEVREMSSSPLEGEIDRDYLERIERVKSISLTENITRLHRIIIEDRTRPAAAEGVEESKKDEVVQMVEKAADETAAKVEKKPEVESQESHKSRNGFVSSLRKKVAKAGFVEPSENILSRNYPARITPARGREGKVVGSPHGDVKRGHGVKVNNSGHRSR